MTFSIHLWVGLTEKQTTHKLLSDQGLTNEYLQVWLASGKFDSPAKWQTWDQAE